MINHAMVPWHSVVRPDLIDRSYSTSRGELAWAKSDALQVVSLLQDKGYHILGVDTWLPTRPGPSPLIRDWDETFPVSAADFIKTFELIPTEQSHSGLEPYFNITVALG